MKPAIALIGAIAIIAALGAAIWLIPSPIVAPAPAATSSSTAVVSSTPPSPAPGGEGTVTGQVLLGPTCPVERIPPEPQCAPRPYATTIHVQSAENPSTPYATISSNASGAFSVSLDPGVYTFTAQGSASMPPTCRPVQVTVVANIIATTTIDCDTGIR